MSKHHNKEHQNEDYQLYSQWIQNIVDSSPHRLDGSKFEFQVERFNILVSTGKEVIGIQDAYQIIFRLFLITLFLTTCFYQL